MKILTLLSVILFIPSCYYNDMEVYEVDITPSNTLPISITSNLTGNDSITINDSLFFEYNIDYDTGRVYYANLFIDDYLIFQSDSISNSLWINPSDFNPIGLFELNMVVYYKTYSGSLADKLNAEPMALDTTWQID